MPSTKHWLVGVIREGNGGPEVETVPHGRTANARFREYQSALTKLGIEYRCIETPGGGAAVTRDACYFYTSVTISTKEESEHA